jgi:hypothetical protein
MRTTLTFLVLSLLVVSVLPGVLAASVGGGISPDIETLDFEPQVFLCDDRVVLDDSTEPGRLTGEDWLWWCQEVSSYEVCGELLYERINNYAFEGEQIVWDVLVFDKNGIEKIEDVFVTIGSSQGEGNDIEANCILDYNIHDDEQIDPSCNAHMMEEELDYLPDNVAAYYKCILTVETSESMYGEHWVTVEAVDLDGNSGTMDENEYWFLNPVIALSIEGDLEFEDVLPGSPAYSSTLLVGNDADDSSGVLMDMFISGTDFYDSSSSGAKCPLTNQLLLGDGDSLCDVGPAFSVAPNSGVTDPFCYFATHGAYSSQTDLRGDNEGYVGINYGIGFNDPAPFYGVANGDTAGYELIQDPTIWLNGGPYFSGNVVSPGSEVAVTFRLNLPEPCNGDFDTGSIYFWGEAI